MAQMNNMINRGVSHPVMYVIRPDDLLMRRQCKRANFTLPLTFHMP
jgi:hypothetical protein